MIWLNLQILQYLVQVSITPMSSYCTIIACSIRVSCELMIIMVMIPLTPLLVSACYEERNNQKREQLITCNCCERARGNIQDYMTDIKSSEAQHIA